MKNTMDLIIDVLDKYKTKDAEYYQLLQTILFNMQTPDDIINFHFILSNAEFLDKKVYIKNIMFDTFNLENVGVK